MNLNMCTQMFTSMLAYLHVFTKAKGCKQVYQVEQLYITSYPTYEVESVFVQDKYSTKSNGSNEIDPWDP